jgi:acetolactate synthase-1/2/3 large subunit
MSEVVSPVKPQRGSPTAENLVKQKARNACVVSGGHLLATALKNGLIAPAAQRW